MANIGTVYTDSYKGKDGNEVKTIVLDIRTITVRKKFTLSVNKVKYEDGVIDVNRVAAGKEEYPDYHIWANLANRGESGKSEIVGSIKNAISEGGLEYKKGKLFDPFVSRYNIYFSLFKVEKEKAKFAGHIYDVVAQPYVKQNSYNNAQNAAATPNYDNVDTGSAQQYGGDAQEADEVF